MTTCTRKVSALAGAFGLLVLPSAKAAIATFEDLSLNPESFNNGSDGAGGFTSGGTHFENSFTDFGGGFVSWDGFSYSNMTDVSTPGFGNQYSAYPGGGAAGSTNFGLGFTGNGSVELGFPEMTDLNGLGMFVANTTYAGLSMLEGDAFAKKFGGADGSDPDWFKLSITGVAGGSELGTVDFYLADFRFDDDSLDYIVSGWEFVDLSSLGSVDGLRFSQDSSDRSGAFLNTPSYFALDNVGAVPEPSLGTLGLATGLLFCSRRRRS